MPVPVNPFSADPRSATVTCFYGSSWSSDRTALQLGAQSRSHAVATVYVPAPRPAAPAQR